MRKLTLALFLTAAPTVAMAQPQEIFWDNNGSLMRTVDDGFKIVPQRLAHKCHKPIGTFAEVNRLRRNQHPNASRNRYEQLPC